MSSPSFDVLTEPWIPVIRLDGSHDEMGIVRCLEEAHDLREIRDPSPIVEFGLYRLLIAFVFDALILAGRQLEDPDDLRLLIEEHHFDLHLIQEYVERCGDVFDLFHPERPFLQARVDKGKSKPLAGVSPITPSGTNVSHWHHGPEDGVEVSVPEAVRMLTTIAPFMTAGGAGLSPSINGAPAIYALPMGRSVFETIVLNMPLSRDQEGGEGVIAWQSKRLPGQERSQATTVEALTWRPRQVQLIPIIGDKNRVSVREMKFERGDSTRLNWVDANLAYRYDKDSFTPIRMRENRPLWRDAGPLLLLDDDEHGREEKKISFRRPDVVEQAFALADASDSVAIQVYGMRTDMKMKVFEWAKSTWSVPSKLGRCTRLGSLVQHELDRAERAAYALRGSIKALYPREGAGNKDALKCVGDRCERAYWQRLEYGFRPLMSAFAALDADAPDDPALMAATARDWREAIRALAFEQFELAAKDMDADADALERLVRARTRLDNTLRKVLL